MDAAPPATAPSPPASGIDVRTVLLERLRGQIGSVADGSSSDTRTLVARLEQEQPADLVRDGALLEGVWQLRWSSSALPYLMVAPWLENLQVLDPARGRGANLLRLAGPLGELAAITVQAAIGIEPACDGKPPQRVSVRFERGGWQGPMVVGQRLQLLRQVKQSFPAWLDITVLDQELRVCRGNAGTLFALLRREDLKVSDFLAESPAPDSPVAAA